MRDTVISPSLVVRIAKNDLQLKVFQRREIQSLTTADKLKRLNACKHLKKRMTQRSVILGSWMKRFLPWKRLLSGKTIACMPL